MSTEQTLFLLALLIPLTIDTFVLSAALGLAGLPKKQRLRLSLVLATFEAIMPAVGVLIGLGLGEVIGKFAGYTAAAIIALAGIILLRAGKASDKQRRKKKLLARTRGLAIIDLGLSISLDELAIGLSLGLLGIPLPLIMVFLGVQAFIASQLGLWIGGRLSEKFREGAERAAGIVLIVVALALVGLKFTGDKI